MESNDIRSVLRPGERLIWSGHPGGEIRLTRAGCKSALFALFFTGFSLFWMAAAGIMGAGQGFQPMGFPFWMFGIPFFLVGLFMLFSPVFTFATRGKVTYAVTYQRVLIRRTGPFSDLTSREIGPETPIKLIGDGRFGTIQFGEISWNPEYEGPIQGPVSFHNVEDARAVYDQITLPLGRQWDLAKGGESA